MGLRGPTLDDVFLQLTGQAPSENGGPATAAAVVRDPASRAPALGSGDRTSFSLRDVRSNINDIAVVTIAEPAALLAPARPAPVLDDPADHVHRPLRLRLRRRRRPGAAAGSLIRRLSPARDLRPVGDVSGQPDGRRSLGGPPPRRDRPLPLDADGALGRPARAHHRGSRAQRRDHRPDDRRRVSDRLQLPGRLPAGARAASLSSPPSGSP